MAKNPENVKAFYESLVPKLQPIWEKEKAEILKLKEEEVIHEKYSIITIVQLLKLLAKWSSVWIIISHFLVC